MRTLSWGTPSRCFRLGLSEREIRPAFPGEDSRLESSLARKLLLGSSFDVFFGANPAVRRWLRSKSWSIPVEWRVPCSTRFRNGLLIRGACAGECGSALSREVAVCRSQKLAIRGTGIVELRRLLRALPATTRSSRPLRGKCGRVESAKGSRWVVPSCVGRPPAQGGHHGCNTNESQRGGGHVPGYVGRA